MQRVDKMPRTLLFKHVVHAYIYIYIKQPLCSKEVVLGREKIVIF